MANDDDDLQLLTIDDVLRLVPVTRKTLFRMERDGRFPRSRQISDNRRVWRKADIREWERDLPVNSRYKKRKAV